MGGRGCQRRFSIAADPAAGKQLRAVVSHGLGLGRAGGWGGVRRLRCPRSAVLFSVFATAMPKQQEQPSSTAAVLIGSSWDRRRIEQGGPGQGFVSLGGLG